jgi:hypothetical protein
MSMKNDGQTFLTQLASLPPDTFESRFSKACSRLDLGANLSRNELTLLYEASLRATLCNVAINNPAGPDSRLNVKEELNRIKAEREFMVAREIFYASPGWQNLTPSEQVAIQNAFLQVAVPEDKLAS